MFQNWAHLQLVVVPLHPRPKEQGAKIMAEVVLQPAEAQVRVAEAAMVHPTTTSGCSKQGCCARICCHPCPHGQI
jgi:hypothetical protein